jgi:hypothetical protein
MLEMDWGDNRKIIDRAKHVVVVASGKVESCNSGSDARARIALEVTHKVGKLVDIRERSMVKKVLLIEQSEGGEKKNRFKNKRKVYKKGYISENFLVLRMELKTIC